MENDYSAFFIAALSFIVIVVVLGLSYVSRSAFNPRNENTQKQDAMVGTQKASITILPPEGGEIGATQVQQNNVVPGGMNATNAGDRVVYKISQFKKLALQPLEFEVFDQNKKAFKPEDLKEVNGAKMHYIFVSANLKDYQHLQPTFKNGKWQTLAAVPNAGTYYGFVEITPLVGNSLVLRSELIAQQASTDALKYPDLTTDQIFTAKNGLKTTLKYANNIFSYLIVRANKPVVGLQPMMGAFGYVTLFKHGEKNSISHPLPTNTSKPDEGKVEFISALEPGIYTAFAEFKVLNRVTSFPITFEVK